MENSQAETSDSADLEQQQHTEELVEMIACLSDTLKQLVSERDLLKAELDATKASTGALKRALDITRQELKNDRRHRRKGSTH